MHMGAYVALDYLLFSSFSKIFRTKSKDVVDECMLLFECSYVLTVVNKRKAKFLDIAENEKKRNHNTVV